MARAIYALKLYLFRHEIELDSDSEYYLRRFCLFVSLVYTKYWNLSSNASDAAFNDINFLKELDKFKRIDHQTASVALDAFGRHLWYLSDELILLSLFSNKVSMQEKLDLIILLTKHIGRRTENSIKFTGQIVDIQKLELSDFISTRSYFLLHMLDIDLSFLERRRSGRLESK